MTARFQGIEVEAHDFADGVDNRLRGLDGLCQAASHPDVEQGEGWQAASIVHVRVPEELLADAPADILSVESRPWIRHSVFGLAKFECFEFRELLTRVQSIFSPLSSMSIADCNI